MRGSSLLVQVASLARRSTLRTLRQPAVVVSAILFPMMFFAINAYGLDAATNIPGFPTDSYLTFALAVPFVQGALFAANSAGTNMANDIESGFLNRLSLTPLRRVSLMMGQLTGILALGLIQALTFVAVGLVFGNGDDLTDVVRALDSEGLRVAHLAVHEPTLDDVFLEKTGRSLEGEADTKPEPAPEPAAA